MNTVLDEVAADVNMVGVVVLMVVLTVSASSLMISGVGDDDSVDNGKDDIDADDKKKSDFLLFVSLILSVNRLCKAAFVVVKFPRLKSAETTS